MSADDAQGVRALLIEPDGPSRVMRVRDADDVRRVMRAASTDAHVVLDGTTIVWVGYGSEEWNTTASSFLTFLGSGLRGAVNGPLLITGAGDDGLDDGLDDLGPEVEAAARAYGLITA